MRYLQHFPSRLCHIYTRLVTGCPSSLKMINNHFTLSLTSTQQIYLTYILLVLSCQPVRWLMKNCHTSESISVEGSAGCH